MQISLENIQSIIFIKENGFYKVTLFDEIIAWVPNNQNNSDYNIVQEWLNLNKNSGAKKKNK